MNYNEFHEIIIKRSTIHDEWYTEVEKCWEEMIYVFSKDVNKTIQFLQECTADEFSWFSEIVEGVAKKTRSKDLITALRKTAEKFPEETKKYNINDFIESADCIVNNNDESQN